MQDDEPFSWVKNRSFIALAEVKTNVCDLNGPSTNRDRQNLHKVLRALGAFPEVENGVVADALYERGTYQSQLYHVSLLCLGKKENPHVAKRYAEVPQITWSETLSFIFERFAAYRRQKESHGQWDEQGQALWKLSEETRNSQEFVNRVGVFG